MTEGVKIRKPGSRVPVPSDPNLYPGDTVEYGLTVEVKHPRKGSFWVKVGATSTIRDGETDKQARERLHTYVHETCDQQVLEILT